ncbi:hypothetical protein NECAME_13118 [Necator americanus]|uniref:Uncharacterized protein n=1 Tax=Necator americanus TaxID=51031 RepID=W2SZR0_NECAM|nr:hypothetical protein NECAME_13118 [Necator americanus]ETN74212.1 hypothetical protein NECAME_13118 [Necator americanus]
MASSAPAVLTRSMRNLRIVYITAPSKDEAIKIAKFEEEYDFWSSTFALDDHFRMIGANHVHSGIHAFV